MLTEIEKGSNDTLKLSDFYLITFKTNANWIYRGLNETIKLSAFHSNTSKTNANWLKKGSNGDIFVHGEQHSFYAVFQSYL